MRRRQAKKNYKKRVAAKNEIYRQLGKPQVAFMGFDTGAVTDSGGLYFRPLKGN